MTTYSGATIQNGSRWTFQSTQARTGVAAAIGFLHLGRSPLGIVNIAAFVASAVYLADVRPAVRSVLGRGGQNSQLGPYGPW